MLRAAAAWVLAALRRLLGFGRKAPPPAEPPAFGDEWLSDYVLRRRSEQWTPREPEFWPLPESPFVHIGPHSAAAVRLCPRSGCGGEALALEEQGDSAAYRCANGHSWIEGLDYPVPRL